MKTTNAILAIASIACVLGCSASTTDVEAEQPNAETSFTETAVHLNTDGTQTVVSRVITASEERKQIVLRDSPAGVAKIEAPGIASTSEALSKDAGCVGSSFWLYDLNNRTGNKICFFGAGTVHLADFKNCAPGQDPATCPTWGEGKGNNSYWAGNASGHFQERYSNCVAPHQYHCPDFKAYQISEFVSWCEAFKPDLSIADNWCVPPNVSTDWVSPMTATGNNYSPGGAITIQVLSSTSSLIGTHSATADSTGHVSKMLGNGFKDGIQCVGNNCGSCGETIKMIDVKSGAFATTPSKVCYEPNKS